MSHNIGEKGTVMIEIQNLTKVFQEQTVLQNINATFDAGLIHGVIGKNGAGKTVLLRLLCGLMHPSKGQVIVDGKQLGKDVDFAPDAGIIIETPCFLPYLSGFQNLKELASIRNIISKEEIAEAMEQVKLDPSSRKHVGKYSLGMRQRLGIAQAIMERPRYLILDEPMNGLDTQGMEDVRELLQKQKETGVTVILASHSMEDIARVADRVLVMNESKVFLFDETAKVFSHAKELEQIGLRVPQVTKIMMKLHENGYPVDPAVFTLEQAVKEILPLVQRGAAND